MMTDRHEFVPKNIDDRYGSELAGEANYCDACNQPCNANHHRPIASTSPMTDREQAAERVAKKYGWRIITPAYGIPTFADQNGDPLFSAQYYDALLDSEMENERLRAAFDNIATRVADVWVEDERFSAADVIQIIREEKKAALGKKGQR